MRTRLTITAGTAALALAGSVFAAAPANAADTNATFEITAGASTVTISVPASTVALGTAASGAASVSGNLGTVTVTDERAKLLPAWTITASSTDFTTGTGTAPERVTAANIAYANGTVSTSGAGTGAFTPTPLVAMSSTTPALVGAYVGVAGNKTASWAPELTFTLGANQVAGTYSGTVTHSLTVAN